MTAGMVSDDEYTFVYSPIRRTIQRSKSESSNHLAPVMVGGANIVHRVLIATIRDFGTCPCPRCKISKDLIPSMGTPADRTLRVVSARRDNEARRAAVASARMLINEKGYVVNSERVEVLLSGESLVPTEVRRHP